MGNEIESVIATARHRNGVSGAPLGIVLFRPVAEYRVEGHDRRFVGIVFPEKGHTAVLDVELLEEGVVAFGENSWRGDTFEDELIEALEAAGNSPYAEEEEDEEKEYEVQLAIHEYVTVKVMARDEAEANVRAEGAWVSGEVLSTQGSDVEVTGIREA